MGNQYLELNSKSMEEEDLCPLSKVISGSFRSFDCSFIGIYSWPPWDGALEYSSLVEKDRGREQKVHLIKLIQSSLYPTKRTNLFISIQEFANYGFRSGGLSASSHA